MTRSLNELTGMIQKAARGADIPLGHADELANAGARLIASGGDAGEVSRALQDPTGIAMKGPAIIDAVLAAGKEVILHDADTPALMLAMVAARGADVVARIDGIDVIVSPGQADGASVTGPVTVPEEDWNIWSELAAKTYVPATEASRNAGAGAGLTDND